MTLAGRSSGFLCAMCPQTRKVPVSKSMLAPAVLIALDLGQLIGLRLGHSEADVVSPDGGC